VECISIDEIEEGVHQRSREIPSGLVGVEAAASSREAPPSPRVTGKAEEAAQRQNLGGRKLSARSSSATDPLLAVLPCPIATSHLHAESQIRFSLRD